MESSERSAELEALTRPSSSIRHPRLVECETSAHFGDKTLNLFIKFFRLNRARLVFV